MSVVVVLLIDCLMSSTLMRLSLITLISSQRGNGSVGTPLTD